MFEYRRDKINAVGELDGHLKGLLAFDAFPHVEASDLHTRKDGAETVEMSR